MTARRSIASKAFPSRFSFLHLRLLQAFASCLVWTPPVKTHIPTDTVSCCSVSVVWVNQDRQGTSQPEVGQSRTAAAGDALTREDSEKQTSALGFSLLSLQERVLIGLGDLPAEQLDKCRGGEKEVSLVMGLPRVYRQGTNRAAKEGNRNTCNIAWVMGCTRESWPAGTPEPCALPDIPTLYSSAPAPAHQLRSGGHLLPPLLKRGATESSTSHLAGPK